MTRDTVSGDELLSGAHAIGQYYGFTPFSSLSANASRLPAGRQGSAKASREKTSLADADNGFKDDPTAEAIGNFLKQYRNILNAPAPRQPVFIWHTNIAPGRPAQKKASIQFHALGTDRTIADVVIIRALLTLSREIFKREPVVRINSLGDKETHARYVRELGNFFKKRAQTLPEECLVRAKQSVCEAAEFLLASAGCVSTSSGGGWADDIPSPIEHLSDASRKRFEDLLEYLEMTGTPYELARNLTSRCDAWNDTCFEITVDGRRVAWGSHYNDLARRIFPLAPFPAVGALLQIPSEGGIVKKVPAARIRYSFVHIGDEAKRLSIRLAEEFRRARLPLIQHIGIESLTDQLHLAEAHGSPYLLIMGRKEALEHSAILRNRQTQEETILPLSDIVRHLKALA